MVGLSNTHTAVSGRTDSDKNVPRARMEGLVRVAQDHLSFDQRYSWKADIHGVCTELITNDFHLYDFWVENWFPAKEGEKPLCHVYAVMGIPEQEPYAYYCTELKTAVFYNTNYYGQCKSWALGMVADYLESEKGVHSIHGAVVDIHGKGLVIIAPTGTGKSTHSYGLTLNHPGTKLHSDDWCYVTYQGEGQKGKAIADISERKFYMRTDIAKNFPRLGELFQRCKLENVQKEDFAAFGNSRAILDPHWIGGAEKFVSRTDLKAVILLRRDKESPAEVKLGTEEAIQTLMEGKYMILPGSGSEKDWGKIKEEPFYNPYLLVRTPERVKMQIDFFRKLLDRTVCYILNTGADTIEGDQKRLLRIAKEMQGL